MPKSIEELYNTHVIEPDLYGDIRGWNSDSPVFAEIIAATDPKIIIEVGSWKGRSAINMAKLAPSAKIYCVDTWLGGIDHLLSDQEHDHIPKSVGYPTLYRTFLSNVANAQLQDRIQPIPNTSSTGAKLLGHFGIQADMIYIDGSHEYEDVRSDLKAYWPLLRPGGIMFGDDYFSFPGIRQAVYECFGEVETRYNNFWIKQR